MTLPFIGIAVFLIFVYFEPSLWFPFVATFRIAFILAIITLILAVLRRSTLPKAKENTLLFFFLLVATLSTIFSISPESSFPNLIELIKTVTTYFLIVLIVDSERRIIMFTYLILMYGAIASFGTLIMQQFGMFMPGIKDSYRLTSYFGGIGDGPNEFGTLMVTLLPLPLALMQGEKSMWKRILLFLIALSFMLCITRTRSRGAFVGLVVIMAYLLWESRGKAGIIVLIGAMLGFTAMHTHSRYWERVSTLSSTESLMEDTGALGREKEIEYAGELLKLRPVFGVGLGNYGKAKVELLGVDPWSAAASRVTHNAYLGIGVEIGIIGMAVFILLVISSVSNCLWSRRVFKESDESFLLYKISNGVGLGLIGFAVCILFLSEQYNSVLYQSFALTVALRRIAETRVVDRYMSVNAVTVE